MFRFSNFTRRFISLILFFTISIFSLSTFNNNAKANPVAIPIIAKGGTAIVCAILELGAMIGIANLDYNGAVSFANTYISKFGEKGFEIVGNTVVASQTAMNNLNNFIKDIFSTTSYSSSDFARSINYTGLYSRFSSNLDTPLKLVQGQTYVATASISVNTVYTDSSNPKSEVRHGYQRLSISDSGTSLRVYSPNINFGTGGLSVSHSHTWKQTYDVSAYRVAIQDNVFIGSLPSDYIANNYANVDYNISIGVATQKVQDQDYVRVPGVGSSVGSGTYPVRGNSVEDYIYNPTTGKFGNPSIDIPGNPPVDVPINPPVDIPGENVGTWEKVLDGINTGVRSIDGTLQGVRTRIGDIATSITGAISSVGDFVKDFFDFTKPVNVQPMYTLGNTFTRKFPFSLPFDLINSIKAFDVKSTPPKFVIPVNLPGAKTDITIDFAMFEKWAVIIRFFIMGSFVVGLIVVTRRVME